MLVVEGRGVKPRGSEHVDPNLLAKKGNKIPFHYGAIVLFNRHFQNVQRSCTVRD